MPRIFSQQWSSGQLLWAWSSPSNHLLSQWTRCSRSWVTECHQCHDVEFRKWNYLWVWGWHHHHVAIRSANSECSFKLFNVYIIITKPSPVSGTVSLQLPFTPIIVLLECMQQIMSRHSSQSLDQGAISRFGSAHIAKVLSMSYNWHTTDIYSEWTQSEHVPPSQPFQSTEDANTGLEFVHDTTHLIISRKSSILYDLFYYSSSY